MPLVSCPSCRGEISSRAKQCKHCFEFVPAGPASQSPPATISSAPSPRRDAVEQPLFYSGGLVNHGQQVVKRYRDAYAVAKALDDQGQTLKGLAVVVALIIAVATMAAAPAAAQIAASLFLPVLVVGAIAAFAGWSTLHGRGVSVAAEGQQLLASLDIAVNTSPFLSDSQRAEAMSL